MISPWMGDRNTLQNWWQHSDSEVWWPASWASVDESGGCRVPVLKGLYGMTVVSLGEEGLGSRSTHAKLRDKAS